MPRKQNKKRTQRRLLRIAAALLTVMALLGSGWLIVRPESPPPRDGISPHRVVKRADSIPSALLIDGQLGPRFAGEIVAHRRGLLPPHVDVRAEPGAPDFVADVVRRGAIGVTTGAAFLAAAWRGVPVTAFAASLLETPTVILTLESSGLRRPSDLIGKTIGHRRGSEGDIVVDAMLTQLGLPRSRISKIDGADSIAALRTGTVDAIISSVDRLPQPSDADFVRTNRMAPQDFAIHVPGLVYFTSTKLLQEHRAEVLAILEALIDGWRFVYADYARSVPVIVGSDPGRLRAERVRFDLDQQRDLVLPTGGRIGDYDDSRWRTLRDVLIFAKVGDETVPLPQSVDFQLLREAYRRARETASSAAIGRGSDAVGFPESTSSVVK
ncbi:ABC transporter substrate-binding protein [Rhodopseudomonas sp. AAP120]|uniref:ABC transporter substrate-binding protein n=1 Tax=Rhodopseudomonas sp. AAP120 TaxID=1523430 RepID=UPI000AE17719|nr:ABC transporter substrate-binding protein [Rhodopseudomonas sp. AAP120]